MKPDYAPAHIGLGTAMQAQTDLAIAHRGGLVPLRMALENRA
jgi:hypothetical protein